jgi:glycosyltransferase involved in cell wall biosynthesis
MTPKPRVVVLHNIISPHVTPIFQALAKEVELEVVYCAAGEANRTWNEKPEGYHYQVLRHTAIQLKGKDLFTYFINPDILRVLKELKPDVVIIAGWDLLSYQLACLYCKLKKIPYILWSGSTRYEPSWRRSLSWGLVWAMIKGASGYVAYGSRAQEYLQDFGALSDKITIALNSTRPDYYHLPSLSDKTTAALQKKLGLENKRVILFYGQLIERKGVDLLLDAFALLQSTHQDLGLLIVGTGQEKPALLEQVQELGLSGVVFVDNPADEQMAKYFYLSEVLVLPSREEVWGLVVNQALLCGLPVVVSDKVGAGPDLVIPGKTGAIFALDDSLETVQRLASSVEEALALAKRKQTPTLTAQQAELASPQKAANSIAQAIKNVLE